MNKREVMTVIIGEYYVFDGSFAMITLGDSRKAVVM